MNALLSHDRLLEDAFLYTWNTYPKTRRLIFHVRNETQKLPYEDNNMFRARMAREKGMGVVPGVMDLVFLWHKPYAFDAKVGDDTLSNDQQKFIYALRSMGGNGWEFRSLEQFKQLFDAVMNGTNT